MNRLKRIQMLGRFVLIVVLVGVGFALSPAPAARAASRVVNSTNDADDGTCNAAHCSLREAINVSNISPGSDQITFNLGTATITPTDKVPPLTDNGTTIYGGGIITVDGSGAGLYTSGFWIKGADNIKIQGLTITNFDYDAVFISNGSVNNIVGVDGDGMNDSLEGNVLISNGSSGVSISCSVYPTPEPCFATDNVVAGNKIGVAADGVTLVPNESAGVGIQGSAGNRVGTNNDGLSDDFERNVISGNEGHGIALNHADDNEIVGNRIGVDISATLPRGNGYAGIQVSNSDSNLIRGNFIGDNGHSGMSIAAASNNIIVNNYIGTDATLSIDLGNNWQGIYLRGSAYDSTTFNQIGTLGYPNQFEPAGNVIMHNGSGIFMGSADDPGYASYNSILYNTIYMNGFLPIDLYSGVCPVTACVEGPTPNDAGDIDSGANDVLNYPIMFSAKSNGTNTYISAQIDSGLPNTPMIIQFFLAPVCNPDGLGEGVYLGEATVTTNLLGDASTGTITIPTPSPIGSCISATATSYALSPLNTSEFSPPMTVVEGNKFTIMAVTNTWLMTSVSTLVSEQQLDSRNGDALRATLNGVSASLERQDAAGAISQLEDFKRQVNGLMQNQLLLAVHGQPLIDAANDAIRVLGWP